MKYVFLLMSMVLFFSCKSDVEEAKMNTKESKVKIYKRPNLQKILKKDVIASAEKGEFQSSAILGHSMGMSRDTMVRFLGGLRKSGKLNLIKNNRGKNELSYVLRTQNLGNLDVFFDAFYDDERQLYMLECRPKVDEERLNEYHEEIVTSLSRKYGEPRYLYENDPCQGKVWIEKTLVIEQFCQEGEVVIQYWDGQKLDYGIDEL